MDDKAEQLKRHSLAAWRYLGALSQLLLSRAREDKLTVYAGHLAYVSLLSLVPFVMVFFTILAAFPAFADIRQQLEDFIFSNFVPTASGVIQDYITEFVGNASRMSAVGILSLLVVALLLISNIDATLNRIWRTKSSRSAIYTFAIYWMVLTLGPLLIGSSVAVSSYLLSLAASAEEYTPGLSTLLLKAVPIFTSIAAFMLVYMTVPNAKVSSRHALAGAIVATLLFEFSKRGFALYITSFPSYQVIYGALAVIPILFLWVYLSWVIVLFGAEITCCVGLLAKDQQKPLVLSTDQQPTEETPAQSQTVMPLVSDRADTP